MGQYISKRKWDTKVADECIVFTWKLGKTHGCVNTRFRHAEPFEDGYVVVTNEHILSFVSIKSLNKFVVKKLKSNNVTTRRWDDIICARVRSPIETYNIRGHWYVAVIGHQSDTLFIIGNRKCIKIGTPTDSGTYVTFLNENVLSVRGIHQPYMLDLEKILHLTDTTSMSSDDTLDDSVDF